MPEFVFNSEAITSYFTIRRLHFLESSLEDMVRAVTAQEQRMSAIKQKLETVETTMHIEEGWIAIQEHYTLILTCSSHRVKKPALIEAL